MWLSTMSTSIFMDLENFMSSKTQILLLVITIGQIEYQESSWKEKLHST
jgi:hypothetical protein